MIFWVAHSEPGKVFWNFKEMVTGSNFKDPWRRNVLKLFKKLESCEKMSRLHGHTQVYLCNHSSSQTFRNTVFLFGSAFFKNYCLSKFPGSNTVSLVSVHVKRTVYGTFFKTRTEIFAVSWFDLAQGNSGISGNKSGQIFRKSILPVFKSKNFPGTPSTMRHEGAPQSALQCFGCDGIVLWSTYWIVRPS